MNLIYVLTIYFYLALSRCDLLNIPDYLSQLQKKPRYKRVVHVDSGESRRDINRIAAPIWPIYQEGLDRTINSGHKIMRPSFRSVKYFGRPNYRSQNNIGIKHLRDREENILKQRLTKMKVQNDNPTKLKMINIRKRPLLLPAALNADPLVPRIGGLHPGHTLLKPKGRTLNSAANYPKDNTDHLVYGNPNHFGITYNKSRDRLLYSDFRRVMHNNDDDVVMNTVLEAIFRLKHHQEQAGRKGSGVIVIGIEPKSKTIVGQSSNEATEVMDLRRSKRYKNHEKMNRENKYAPNSRSRESTMESSSDSKDFDKNPGNPYTLHKNRYHQNWMWNHFMDGDHMNIDPYGPRIQAVGPTGFDLFFGRKWWYFNQDDYKPMG